MLGLVVVTYLLLAIRVRIRTEASIWGTTGALLLSAQAVGITFRFDGVILRKKKGIFLTVKPRFGRLSRKRKPGEERGKSIRMIRRYLWFARTGKMERLSLDARVGLGDAAQTAVAAGCLRALASAAFMKIGSGASEEMCITPDFDHAGVCVQLRCIFSCQAGDIMLAAARAALQKNRREGLVWKSIPLKA